MQVPDEVKKCVVFIGCRTKEAISWGGTGFFIGIPTKELKDKQFTYLITAKHCIDGIKESSIDQKVLIRMNLKSGSTQIIEFSVDDWKFHPTEQNTVDVAILQWVPSAIFDYLVLPVEGMIVSEKVIEEQSVGAGDEVFITGLFRLHVGTKRNLPIIRTGNIALMPEEKVPVKKLGLIDAYLIEARSLGGLSGSPVFLYLGVIRNLNGKIAHVQGTKGGAFHWLGLIHGHWDVDESMIDSILEDSFNRTSVNMGIAIVIPAIKIMEVVNQPIFSKYRNQAEQELKELTWHSSV